MGSTCSGLSRGRGRTYDQSYGVGAAVVQATATDTSTHRLGEEPSEPFDQLGVVQRFSRLNGFGN